MLSPTLQAICMLVCEMEIYVVVVTSLVCMAELLKKSAIKIVQYADYRCVVE